MSRINNITRANRVPAIGGALLVVFAAAAALQAQEAMFRVQGAVRGFFRGAAVAPGAEAAKTDDDGETLEGDFADGAALKTDPEAKQLLKRADKFAEENRFDLAAVLWQRVLDDSGDSLVAGGNGIYVSLRRRVEQRLAELPPLGLQTYRVTADGEAKAVLSAAGPEKQEEALQTVVRRFFMSSLGDDAAYRVGCLALDGHDFVGASRAFSKVLEEHPDPSIPRGDILLRLAVATARAGDAVGATKWFEQLASISGPGPSRATVASVRDSLRRQLEAAGGSYVVAQVSSPALPPEATAKTLTTAWSYEYPLLFADNPVQMNMYGGYDGRPNKAEKTLLAREQLIDRWKNGSWTPASRLIIDGGRVYVKTNQELLCWSVHATDDRPLWKSAWLNEFELDELTQSVAMFRVYGGNQGLPNDSNPRSPAEVFMFGDRIQQSMSLAGGTLYSIEGRRVPRHGPAESTPAKQKQFNYAVTPRRTRVNWLAAYDARTGKAKWHRSASDEAKENEGDMGFLAAPTVCGEVLLAPVTDAGAIWLYGMSPATGRTIWKTYLCDEPVGGCKPWSPVGVTVEGREAYVASGCGVIFAVEGTTGGIRWAARYAREEKRAGRRPMNMHGGQANLREYDGFEDDSLVAQGRVLVVMASDSNSIWAMDRRTGELLWKSPRTSPFGTSVDYPLGIHDRGLFTAGKNTVRRYDIQNGKLIWERDLVQSLGRGTLTDDAIYMPVKDSVLKLDLEKGRSLEQVGVRVGSDDPVGNLFSDGKRLWMTAANRVASLDYLEYHLAILEKRIEQGDVAALAERMRLRMKAEEWDAVIDDLRSAHRLLSKDGGAEGAAAKLLPLVEELKLAVNRPQAVFMLCSELLLPSFAELKPETRARCESVLFRAVGEVAGDKKYPGVTAGILSVAPLMQQDYLINASARAVRQSATKDDFAALEAALSGKNPNVVRVAAEGWALLDPKAAKPKLTELSKSENAWVRFASSRALLQTGDRQGVEPLIDLLLADDAPLRHRAFQSLRLATGQTLPFTAYGGVEERTGQTKAWREWLAKEGTTFVVRTPLPDAMPLLGHTLVASHLRNWVVEFDATGKEISKQAIQQPWGCFGLPNGNRLVASFTQNGIKEYDKNWKEVWSVEGLPSGVFGVQRTAEGTTIVVCADAGEVIEISANKTKKRLWQGRSRPLSASRLENGNTLICLQGGNSIIEIDSTGKQVWEAANLMNPMTAQRLENGNTLAAVMNSGMGQIVEIDPTGRTQKVVKQNVRQLNGAFRVPNGNTIYSDALGITEIDPDGKTVWSRREPGVSGFSRF